MTLDETHASPTGTQDPRPDRGRANDSVSDVLRAGGNALDPFFAPGTVAVVGATEKAGSVGRTVLWNLISSPFGGTVLPINPNRPSILGIKAYPNLATAPGPIDLAVVVTPASSVPPSSTSAPTSASDRSSSSRPASRRQARRGSSSSSGSSPAPGRPGCGSSDPTASAS